MRNILAPSILAADFANLGRDMDAIKQAGAEYVHIDVMDGMFVPSISFGMPVIQSVRPVSDLVFDVHLMIEEPIRYIDLFADCGVDIIYLHPDSEYHVITALQRILELKLESGIVLNPGTSVYSIVELLNVVKRVMVMGVNPGQAGQLYLPYAEKKIDMP